MPEYLESSVSGLSWRRASQLSFFNPSDKPPYVEIAEEDVVRVGDKITAKPAAGITKVVTDLTPVFQLRNPQTNEVIPDAYANYEQLYVLLFSLYWHLAEERDNTSNHTPPELPDETVI